MRTQQILCPTDFSETASHALTYAIEMANLYGVNLRILHVASEPYGTHNYGISVHSDHEIEDKMFAYAHGRLDKMMQEALSKLNPGLKVESQIRVGGVLGQILIDAESCKVGMIVIASHGHTGLSHLLNSNVAEAVANKAKCPVLVVK
ncbi:universal stress protein [Shewanella sp. Isolate11]|uniref:universal stress protein n=1 Tax=Shewanella sp. Isolate11 TaxID=2908530 RepID=UPI001EFD3A22|nr:universal stress protein [Shewanella sp. Isolate11]MCG9695751.1 universal stress protein [Shewanella sp. Isolate11]